MNSNKLNGMFIGLAIGDALGAFLEFKIYKRFEKISDYHSGGPFNLPAGYWTDDTSMALCLADSFVEVGGYDSFNVMEKYLAWMRQGFRSSTGKCFDIGIQTAASLERFEENQWIEKGVPRTQSAGNGSIMRLAPVVIASIVAGLSLDETAHVARVSARETHYSYEAEYWTGQFAEFLYRVATQDVSVDSLIKTFPPLREHEDIADLKQKIEYDMKPTGYIVDTLEVALWGFITTNTFEEGMLKVINLGGDSDTIGAVYGQIAGAYYGLNHIPERWISGLHQYEELFDLVKKLQSVKNFKVIKTRFKEDY